MSQHVKVQFDGVRLPIAITTREHGQVSIEVVIGRDTYFLESSNTTPLFVLIGDIESLYQQVK